MQKTELKAKEFIIYKMKSKHEVYSQLWSAAGKKNAQTQTAWGRKSPQYIALTKSTASAKNLQNRISYLKGYPPNKYALGKNVADEK